MSAEQKHTPEPWGLLPAGDGPEALVIVANRMSLLTIVREGATNFAAIYSAADAKRIVACVNACAGIETEALLDFGLTTAARQYSDLEFERNELLRAMKAACDASTPKDAFAIITEAIEKVEARSV